MPKNLVLHSSTRFLNRDAIVDEILSDTILSDEDKNDHDHFIDDRQVLTQMANTDMTRINL